MSEQGSSVLGWQIGGKAGLFTLMGFLTCLGPQPEQLGWPSPAPQGLLFSSRPAWVYFHGRGRVLRKRACSATEAWAWD